MALTSLDKGKPLSKAVGGADGAVGGGGDGANGGAVETTGTVTVTGSVRPKHPSNGVALGGEGGGVTLR